MAQNNTVRVSLPIPLKQETDPATNLTSLVNNTLFYQMRLHDVGVYLLDANSKPLGSGPVQVTLTKAGSSLFFDEDMKLSVFTHAPVRYGSGTFVYDSSTGCPQNQADCGDMCQKFIRYSPFGEWDVQVYSPEKQNVNMSKLVSLRFEFQVDYQQIPGLGYNFFGKSPELYPQNFGKLCNKEDE